MAVLRVHRGDVQGAQVALEQALEMRTQQVKIRGQLKNVDPRGECVSLGLLADVHFKRGEIAKAIAFHKRAWQLAHTLQDADAEGYHQHRCGEVQLMLASQSQPTAGSDDGEKAKRGRLMEAKSSFEKSLQKRKEMGNRAGMAETMCSLGSAQIELGEVGPGLKLMEEAKALFEQARPKPGRDAPCRARTTCAALEHAHGLGRTRTRMDAHGARKRGIWAAEELCG